MVAGFACTLVFVKLPISDNVTAIQQPETLPAPTKNVTFRRAKAIYLNVKYADLNWIQKHTLKYQTDAATKNLVHDLGSQNDHVMLHLAHHKTGMD
ncbi:hypothetical protein CLOP_g6694 [Closterium sp. NIES-67]|nr:hypothetical protein CLOP_g6694 [Closterium sp. NIES-67]